MKPNFLDTISVCTPGRPYGRASDRSIRYALFVAISLWNAGWIAAAWLASLGSPAASWLYRFYGPICHQLPSRCFYLWDNPLAVCSRCAALYAGFGLVTLVACVWVIGRPHRYWIAAVAGTTGLEVALELAGVRGSSFFSRAAIGLASGAILAPFIITGVEEAISELCEPRPSERVKKFRPSMRRSFGPQGVTRFSPPP